MEVKIVGSGDAFGSGGRSNTCFMINAAAGPVLLDCGASSLIKLKEYGVDPDTIGTIFITHLHGDHFGGLVFLLREATLYKKRTKALTIVGPAGIRERLNSAIEVFFPGGSALPTTFDLSFVELASGGATIVDGIEVNAFAVQHPCGAIPYALRLNVDGKFIGYSADTIWLDCLIDVGVDADLFICEAYTYEKPMGSHLDYRTVLAQLPRIQAKRVLLTHLGPELVSRIPELEIETARDGMTVVI
jgi:ribonuclease BN (tRNA processing enzyme)